MCTNKYIRVFPVSGVSQYSIVENNRSNARSLSPSMYKQNHKHNRQNRPIPAVWVGKRKVLSNLNVRYAPPHLLVKSMYPHNNRPSRFSPCPYPYPYRTRVHPYPSVTISMFFFFMAITILPRSKSKELAALKKDTPTPPQLLSTNSLSLQPTQPTQPQNHPPSFSSSPPAHPHSTPTLTPTPTPKHLLSYSPPSTPPKTTAPPVDTPGNAPPLTRYTQPSSCPVPSPTRLVSRSQRGGFPCPSRWCPLRGSW